MNTLSCNGTCARSFRGLTKLSDPDQFRAVFAFCILFRRGCLSCVDQSWHSVAPPKMPQSKGECVQHLSSFPLSVLTGHNAATARWKDIPDKGPSKQNKLNDEEERKKDRKKEEKQMFETSDWEKKRRSGLSLSHSLLLGCLRNQNPFNGSYPICKISPEPDNRWFDRTPSV